MTVQLLELADQIVLMDKDGNIADSGTYTDLTKRHQLGGMSQSSGPTSTAETRPQATDEPDFGEYRTQLDTKLDDLRRLNGDWKSYAFYIGSMGWFPFSLFVLSTAACVVLSAVFQVWVTWWAEDASGSRGLGYWLGLYALWAVLTMVWLFFTARYVIHINTRPKSVLIIMYPRFFMANLASKASESIHSKLLTAALRYVTQSTLWHDTNVAIRAPMIIIAKIEIGSLVNRRAYLRLSQGRRFWELTAWAGLARISGY